jgi:outer membrane protein assembly factor BamB
VKRDDTSFIPEQLDEQIEHPAEWLAADDQQLIYDLRNAHQAYEHANARSLNHVWERLEQKRQQPSMYTIKTAPNVSLKRNSAMQHKLSSNGSAQEGFKRTLSLIAAVIVVAVLSGSALLLFSTISRNHTAHNNTVTDKPQATSTSIVNSSGIYITYPTTQGNVVLSKLDAQTHKPLWEYTDNTLDAGTPVIYGDVIYLDTMNEQTSQAHLLALNADTGKPIWNVVLKAVTAKGENGSSPSNMGVLTAPVVSNGQVYVMNRAGTVFSFEAKTGKANWTYEAGASALVKQYYTDANGKKQLAGSTIYDGVTPVVRDGILYSALHNTYFAINAKTGKLVWSSNLAEQDQIFNGVQIVDGTIYTASYIASGHNAAMSLQSYVYAFNAHDGKQIWKYSTKKWVTSGPVVSEGHVYFIERIPDMTDVSNGQSTLHALDLQGRESWHKDYNIDIAGSPTVGDGYVSVNMNTYDHTNGHILTHALYVYDAAGNQVWQKNVDAGPVVIQNGVLYTASGRQIIVYDIKSQQVQWSGQYGVDLIDKMGNHSGRLFQVIVVP